MLFVGIDPGAHGGIAFINTAPTEFEAPIWAIPCPTTEADIWTYIKQNVQHHTPFKAFALIEKVGGFIGGGPPCPVCHQPKNRSPGSSMFSFGVSYGGLRMCLIAAGISFEEVVPQTWQKAMGIPLKDNKHGETPTQWKNRLKARAQQIFPSVKVTLATSDALLICEYARRSKENYGATSQLKRNR